MCKNLISNLLQLLKKLVATELFGKLGKKPLNGEIFISAIYFFIKQRTEANNKLRVQGFNQNNFGGARKGRVLLEKFPACFGCPISSAEKVEVVEQ